jgi:hypothetical protein
MGEITNEAGFDESEIEQDQREQEPTAKIDGKLKENGGDLRG